MSPRGCGSYLLTQLASWCWSLVPFQLGPSSGMLGPPHSMAHFPRTSVPNKIEDHMAAIVSHDLALENRAWLRPCCQSKQTQSLVQIPGVRMYTPHLDLAGQIWASIIVTIFGKGSLLLRCGPEFSSVIHTKCLPLCLALPLPGLALG